MKIKAKQIDTTGGLTIQGETINRLTHTDADGKLKAANLLKIDTENGRLGIGTATPTATLDITGDTDGEAQVQVRQHNNSADGPDLSFYRSRGTESSKLSLSANDNVGRVNALSWTGSAYERTGTYGWTATDANGNSSFSLTTRVSGTEADRVAITSAGALKISDAYTLPTADGTSGQVLTTNGSGALSFTSAGASTLDGLSDVNAASPSGDDLLAYNSTSGDWETRAQATNTTISTTRTATAIDNKGINTYSFIDSSVTLTIPQATQLNGLAIFNNTASSAQQTVSGSSVSFALSGRSFVSSFTLEAGETRTFLVRAAGVFHEISADRLKRQGDVNITSPSNGETLVYNSTSGDWENGSVALDGLSDVSTSGVGDQDTLVYNSSTSTWEPKPASAPVAIPLGYPAALTDSGVSYTSLLCAGSESSKGFVMPFSGRLIAMGASAEVTNTDTNNYLRFRPTINGSGSSSRDIEITVENLGYIKGHFDFTDITFNAGDQLSVSIIHNNNGATTENHHALLIVEYDR